VAKILGSPLGLTRELMLNSFDKSNFSNTRAALLSSQRGFEIIQLSEIADFVEPIRERFVEELWLRGDLTAGMGRLPEFEEAREAYLGARYIKPGWPWIDPLKDVQKSKMAIEAGLSTFQREYGDRGLDWETELTQLADERDFITGRGLPVDFVLARKGAAVAGGTDEQGQARTDTDEDTGDTGDAGDDANDDE